MNNENMTSIEENILREDRSLYVRISGTGSPPVIFEAGMNCDSETWQHVEANVAEFTTTVVYDRAGLGRSSPLTTQRTLNTMRSDFEYLLDNLALSPPYISPPYISPPYILVGHSLGGLLVRLYAANHLSKTGGLVLIDAPHEGQHEEAQQRLSAKTWKMVTSFWQQSREAIDLAYEFAQIEPVRSLGDIPLIVLSATKKEGPPPEIPTEVAKELEMVSSITEPSFQKKLAADSTRGQQIAVEGSGHEIHLQRPDIVIETIHNMVLAAQT
ncbi:MAG: alpha/beta hydrolase [Chloroflexota bacterium]